ncbi:hypothetical protein TKK_0016660 [Trichogramma kaykai]
MTVRIRRKHENLNVLGVRAITIALARAKVLIGLPLLATDGVRPAPEATTQGQNASNNRIVILQINAAHAKEVTHEIQLQAVETGIHVATIQEPYVQIDFLPGMGLHVSTVFEKQYHNKKTGATISCFAKEITKLKLTELCEHNVSCVELTGSVSETIVSELLSL